MRDRGGRLFRRADGDSVEMIEAEFRALLECGDNLALRQHHRGPGLLR